MPCGWRSGEPQWLRAGRQSLLGYIGGVAQGNVLTPEHGEEGVS